jgi:hypothetical protein
MKAFRERPDDERRRKEPSPASDDLFIRPRPGDIRVKP